MKTLSDCMELLASSGNLQWIQQHLQRKQTKKKVDEAGSVCAGQRSSLANSGVGR